MNRDWSRSQMRRPMILDHFFDDMDDLGESMAMPMDVDDDYDEPMEMFGGGLFSSAKKLKDANFFNSFEDDFDDSDIN
ncbi:unnamed protein product [Microthlaspi erraticum]|uniref:Small acidic protein 1 n=1 Tax=Microthlaspi erraticum TaxID=1685480 RepID=A0A6D2JH98_9BRAS|nr:unnamed protein product [Microthlaspi erraticum]